MPLLKVSSKPIPAVHEARDGTAMASACVYSGGYRRGDVQGPLLDELGHLGVPAGVCSCSHGSSSLNVQTQSTFPMILSPQCLPLCTVAVLTITRIA